MSTILFWNCCGGLSSKIDTLKTIVAKHNPELIFASEAEVDLTLATPCTTLIIIHSLLQMAVQRQDQTNEICMLDVSKAASWGLNFSIVIVTTWPLLFSQTLKL